MLVSLHNIKGYKIKTPEGIVTHVNDVFFKDRNLKNQSLMSIVKNPDTNNNMFGMLLFDTKNIEDVDPIKSEITIDKTRQSHLHEIPDTDEAGRVAGRFQTDNETIPTANPAGTEAHHYNLPLDDIIGCDIIAKDGKVGHVIDCVVDDRSWRTKYLAVDTESLWYPSNKSLIPFSWAKKIDWKRKRIFFDLLKSTITDCPDYPTNQVTFPDIADAVWKKIAEEN